eukprot:m.37431 g.37431  ORF g.37431 m.37431 type:complete len:489 (+) comp9810_c1_seq1:3987-5453(+)
MWLLVLLPLAIAALFVFRTLYKLFYYERHISKVVNSQKYPADSLPAGAYDAVVVGAGPSGATLGYFAASKGAKVCLVDKAKFPRDKYCGDAVCTPAIHILEEMGVMQELKQHNEAHFADSGGFVSPSGRSYIGRSKVKLGQAAACAVKRVHLDDRIVKASVRAGAELREEFEVEGATFDAAAGLWTVRSSDGKQVQARLLVCADGATSSLATKLGYCTEAPRGVCSRAYVEGGTHRADFDGVCFYQRESLPGYSAIFRHPNDELNYCYYLIPTHGDRCGNVGEDDLRRLHEDAITKDPFISAALGPGAKIERMKAASLRLGGQGIRAVVDDHLLLIGDAAGHIDPLTGEGIHTAMQGGKAAAETLLEMRAAGDYSLASCRAFEDRCWNLFAHDFDLSRKAALVLYRFPILLDATASEMERVGDAMMAKWAEIMTGMQPKTYFLRPANAAQMLVATLREAWDQYVLRRPDRYVMSPDAASAVAGPAPVK